MAKKKKFRMIDAILTVICVVFVAEAAAPAAAIGNQQFFWWIFLILTFLLPYGLIVCELGTTYADDEGGIADWVRRAFGDAWGSRVSWYYWINFPLWMASLAFLFPETIALLTGVELGLLPSLVIELAFVWIVVFMSFSKVSDSGWILNLSAILKVSIAVLVGGLGVYYAVTNGFASDMSPATFLPSTDASSLTYLSIILFNFMGFEAIAVFANDMENPKKQIPTAIIAGGIAIAAIYLFSSFGIGAAIPASEVSLDSGIMDAVAIMAGNGSLLFIIIGVVFLITLFGNMISWSFGVNYVAAHAADKKNMPSVFARLNKKGVPTGAAIVNGVIASALVLVSPVMSAIGLDGFFWIFFSMNIVFLLICYMPMFPAFLKLRSSDPNANRIFRVPGGKAVATVACWVPVVLLILSMIATIVPLNGSEEELSKIPMLIGVVAFAIIGEIVRVVSARKRTEPYRGMAVSGDPQAWDVAHGYIDPAVEAGLEEVAERDREFERA
ncbi:APC family permease [Eggerthella sinensis]|uniref:Amino acid:proton antiporter n=1 Tax=Eggerthella sinensis TaxID=242230 RepID=A0A3N0IN89_9ACTN|nr:APC family permease [Eggerthella sinensis]RDB65093.1 amino acid:proton antiporter [Eggerthella sinensis]RNM38501.1 amino acid:proton antiporter [Eggerthella sinensis]